MKSWLKYGGIAIALVGVAVVAVIAVGERMALQRASRQIEISVNPVPYRSDASALERGHYLFVSRGCVDCHGANGGGRTLVNDG